MRLNVYFNDKQSTRLEELAQHMGCSKARVLQTALALLEVAVREKDAGNSIAVIRGGKVLKEIVGIL